MIVPGHVTCNSNNTCVRGRQSLCRCDLWLDLFKFKMTTVNFAIFSIHYISLHCILYIHSLIHAIFIFWIFRLFINFKTVPNKNINSNIIDLFYPIISNIIDHVLNSIYWTGAPFFHCSYPFFKRTADSRVTSVIALKSKNEIFQNSGC